MKYFLKNCQQFYDWDYFSDQPYPIKDKVYKRLIRLKALPSSLKMLLVAVLGFPVIFLLSRLWRKNIFPIRTKDMIGLCVNADKDFDLSSQLVEDLGVRRLSIRIPLRDISNIDNYVLFLQKFSSCDMLIVILQDREHIENKKLYRESLDTIFSKFSPFCAKYQIGNAINRTKWGFISLDEYFEFFKVAQEIRDQKFPDYTLLGSAIIDFEIYAIIRSMWHLYSLRYDAIASLLYVDRRGAPENKQFSFSLPDKINFIKTCAHASFKTNDRLFITEANWPIEFTRPYAPALDDVWVSESCYANYMLRYFLLAMASGQVETIYWHQLIAPGYGLIDNRNDQVVKREAYFFYKTFNALFSDVEITAFENDKCIFIVKAMDRRRKNLWAVWSIENERGMKLPAGMELVNAFGQKVIGVDAEAEVWIRIGEQVVYLLEK